MRGRAKEMNQTAKAAGWQRRGRRQRRILYAVLAAAVLLLCCRGLASEEMEVTFHHLYSPKIAGGENLRVAVLSDLHDREFGPDNQDLIRQIAVLKPDIIAVAGDMVNARNGDPDVILNLCGKMVEIAPVYYCPGNHESNLMYEQGSPIESQLWSWASTSWSTGRRRRQYIERLC